MKVNPSADSLTLNTMLHDPNQQQQEATGQAVQADVANEVAAVEQEAQEQAMEVDSEEGTTEG